MGFADKIIAWSDLPAWREEQARARRRVVVTNGCFDLLHMGHASCLERARGMGDVLLVGINSDAAVRELKGAGRPIHSEADRAGLVAALASVDAVCVFDAPSTAAFLERARPDVWVKGGDYTLETVNQEERRLVEAAGGSIAFVAMLPGHSTTATLRRLDSR